MGVRNRAFEGLRGRLQGGGDFQQAFTSDEKVELWVRLSGGEHASLTPGFILSTHISTQNHRQEHSRKAKNMSILSSSSQFLLPGAVGLPINSLFLNSTHFNRTRLICVVLETPTDKHTSSESAGMYLRINTLPCWSSLFCGLALWFKSLTLIEVVRVHS